MFESLREGWESRLDTTLNPILDLQGLFAYMMRTDVSTDSLGLWCPEGGSFWICENKPSRFVGCCRFNPCETVSGVCADDNLTPSSFDGRAVHRVAEQDCVRSIDSDGGGEDETDTASWYACAGAKPPFIGCCASDACSQGGCDAMSLRAGRLSDDRDAAASLLVSAASDVDSGRGSISTRAGTAVTALSSPVASETGGLGLTHDGLVALAGALIALLAVAALTVAALLWRLLTRPANPNSPSYVSGSDSAVLPSRDFDLERTAVVAGFTNLGPSAAMRSGPGTTPAPRSPRLGSRLAAPSSSKPTWTPAACSPARVGQPAWESPRSTAATRAPTPAPAPAPAPTLPGGQINLERVRSRSRILSGMQTRTPGPGEHAVAFEDEWGRPERP